ncbi:hypothetical protein [Falsiroseomonas sp.]|uniref:hypothetical protein n=1 Tax=Falsiroseomonas sp. TaxID=2870721 RepID=UPI0035699ADA
MTDDQQRQKPAQTRQGKRRRERILRLRIHAADRARWRAAAERNGVHNLSAWLRAVADQATACGTDPLAWRRHLVGFQRRLNILFEGATGVLAGGTAGLPAGPGGPAQIAAELSELRKDVRAVLLGRRMPRRPRRDEEAGP